LLASYVSAQFLGGCKSAVNEESKQSIALLKSGKYAYKFIYSLVPKHSHTISGEEYKSQVL